MANRIRLAVRCMLLVSGVIAFASPGRAADCEALLHVKLRATTIESAESVPAGDYTTADKVKRTEMPAFCRVVASVKAARDSNIGIEIWLPADGWNGVFHGNGNGGFAGTLAVAYDGMETGLRLGYASATTDMGTAPANVLDGDALIGHPRKWKDWGLLSTHVMTVVGKRIARAFYGKAPRRAYFTGCSTGGQQALIEAEYYPADYDGILAGAPVINRTWGHAAAIWNYRAANLVEGHKLSDAKLALLHATAVKYCAGKGSGLPSDAFIADPLACKFDPAVLACTGANPDACLTPGEIDTARAFYSGPRSQRTGKATYFGWLPGSELGPPSWKFLETPIIKPQEPAFDSLFKWVFGADWNWRTFDFDRDMPKVDAVLGPAVNGAMTGNLRRFRARGGKLVIYQGWADTLVSPLQTIAFYKKVARQAGGMRKAQGFARLFMVPGIGHCGGGSGPNSFNSLQRARLKPPSNVAGTDIFAAMTRWVEDKTPPHRVIATKYIDDDAAKGIALQRPLCPYPRKAWYTGSGSTSDAGNFVCAVKQPKTGGRAD